MFRRLPPLNALRTFECAGRFLSFKHAAEELHVTSSAVSQQIRILEDELGLPLFDRTSKGLALTPSGHRLLAATTRALATVGEALQELRSDRQVIQLSAAPTFCTKWLVPRLGRFSEKHPHIELRIDATDRIANLANGSVDLAVRYAASVGSKLQYELLFLDEVFPVCSPDLERTLGSDPGNLFKTKLLHWSTYSRWERWFEATRLGSIKRTEGIYFSHLLLALDAAISGQGVALASMDLARYDLEAGRLVRPFPNSVKTGYSYYLVARPDAAKTKSVRAFIDWAVQEARLGTDTRHGSSLNSG
jgi:LysR family transcriptional regulator, glycine cleavage system transcriptional activator